MSHIDSVNQEVWAQLLRLCYSVNMLLRRLPTYIGSTFTLYVNFYLAATVCIYYANYHVRIVISIFKLLCLLSDTETHVAYFICITCTHTIECITI